MNKSFDVFTIADLCADMIIIGSNVVPEFGQKEKLVDDYIIELGGSCSIFACQTAKLGLKTKILGNVGCDMLGDMIVAKLKGSGVDTTHVGRINDVKTGISIALCKDSDRAILTYNGSIDTNTVDNVPWDILFQCRHLHIGSFFLQRKIQQYMPYIAQQAKAHRLTVSLDVNWDPDEQWQSGLDELLSYVDIFFPNEEEAKAITGQRMLDEAMSILAQRIPIVVVKRGDKGAIARSSEDIYTCRPLNVKVCDTVGAGDSFDGGFVYGYLSGMDIKSCLKIATICGGLSTTAYGGIAGQPGLDTLFLLDMVLAIVYNKGGNNHS